MPKNIGAQRRYSEHISRRVTQSVFRAFDFAQAIGHPLNNYVVLHLHESTEAGAATLFERVRHKFRDWLVYQTTKAGGAAFAPMYIYSIEQPNDAVHVNWAVHIPEALQAQFEKKLQRWVERVQGSLGPYDVSCQPIRQTHAKCLAKYIVKGTDPAFVDHFFLADVHEPQGQVWGKRAGVSPSLGKTARDKAGFRPRRGRSAAFGPRPNPPGMGVLNRMRSVVRPAPELVADALKQRRRPYARDSLPPGPGQPGSAG